MSDKRSDMMDDLATDARVKQYARMLPMGEIPADKHVEVRDAYLEFLFKCQITDSAVAKAIGISPSALSQWKNGRYKGKTDDITRAINDYMEREGRKHDVRVELPFVTTRIANGMISTARLAYEEQCMAAIVAPAGSGKTKVFEVLQVKMRGFYLTCDEDMRPKTFMQKMAKAVNVDSGGNIAAIKDRIVDKIGGSGRPIFLDEIQLLPRSTMSRVRTLHDQTKCPIIMGGPEEILSLIDDRANGRGQLFSRCITWNATERMYDAGRAGGKSADGATLYSKEEIAKLFEAMPLRLNKSGLEMAWALACLPDYGTLRIVRRIINLVCRRLKSGTIGRDHIIEVLEVFFGARAEHVHNLAKKTIRDHRKAA